MRRSRISEPRRVDASSTPNFRLTLKIAICNHIRVTSAATIPSDRTLKIAERQLAMLDRLAQVAMDVAEGFGSSAIASAKAEERILADEYFIPEIGRARACGAKDAAESFQKASRSLRLTLMLEKTTAEWLDDLESGAPRKDAGETPAVLFDRWDRRRPAGPCSDEGALDRDRRESDRENLFEAECPDVLPHAPFRETVERIGADMGAAIDWRTLDIVLQNPADVASRTGRPNWGERPPPGRCAAVADKDALAPHASP